MKLADYRNIVVLTGAGISQSAGLPTYRGRGGLWSDPELARLAEVSALVTDRAKACGMFWRFRQSIAKVEPTAAHRALAAFEQRLPAATRFLIVTQNVDGLHQAAGSRRVCEYHGSLARWRCEICGLESEPSVDSGQPDSGSVDREQPDREQPDRERRDSEQPDRERRDGERSDSGPDSPPPMCCGMLMRPAAVLFGEMIPAEAERVAKQALRECDLFVAIGTSGTVWPAASFVRWAAINGAHRVLLNLEIFDDARDDFVECREGPADELVTAYFAA
jgi:NAD-dependent deacetylase